MLPKPTFWNSGETEEVTIISFGDCDAGTFRPGANGLEIH
ncbi:unnamed protein product, partial [marine sediment metagenome]